MYGQVTYEVLDGVKLRCIEAAKKTSRFAERFGVTLKSGFGGSANVAALNLQGYEGTLHFTLTPEGLGTADEAYPEDITPDEAYRFWYNIGIKSIATMTNDVATAGLQPVALGLYLPSAEPAKVFTETFLAGFLDGVVEACRKVGCIYLSGETPQLRSKLYPHVIDIAGSVVGILPPLQQPIDGTLLDADQPLVFLASSGPHENGFSVLRNIASTLPQGYRTCLPSGEEYWKAINAPTVLYAPLIQDLLRQKIAITNIEYISGHGWLKILRSRKPLNYIITHLPEIPEIFTFIETTLQCSRPTLLTLANCGVGMCLACKTKQDADNIIEAAHEHKISAWRAGYTTQSSKRVVTVKPWDLTLTEEGLPFAKE